MSRILFALLFLFSFPFFTVSQVDSLNQDSALDANQEQRSKLLASADSAGIADSLEKIALRVQIEALKNSDNREKQRLQERLDSITQAKALRDAETRAAIDSLRASTTGIPVSFNRDTLFYIYSKLGPFSPSERAQRIREKLEKIGDDSSYDPKSFSLYAGENSYDFLYGEQIIFSINQQDAFWLDIPLQAAAEQHEAAVVSAIENYREETSVYKVAFRIGLIFLVAFILYVLVRLLNRGFSALVSRLAKSSNKYMKGIKLKDYEFLSPERQLQLVAWVFNLVKWLAILLIVYLSLPVVFSIFPTTEGFARKLIGYVTDPLLDMIRSLIDFIPSLITIIVIAAVARYVVRFLKFLTSEVEREKLVLPGFYPDWAKPTFNLLRVLIYAFAFIVIFPYLPGSDSPVFQGVSVFLGLLISLGSSSAIGNLIAGLVITYMRPFKIGDRVKIGDVTGDVVEKTMLVTRVRTIKNEDVSIPNASILTGSTINYSSSAHDLGLILHTTITIGYDVPWKQVHNLLIEAASKIDVVLKDPAPFVHQTSLDDFYVSYQINAYTNEAGKGAAIYSALYANIQDGFNEAGLEVLSPHYRAQRDGSPMAVPADYLPPNYQPTGIKVDIDRSK